MESHEELRPYLFAIAYRMLGSVAEAEDVVQDAFLRYHEAEVEAESPKAYLATVTTRLAIDELRSARARREVYPGQWLPEPLVEDDAVRHAETADSLSLAFLHLLEKLSPVERACRPHGLRRINYEVLGNSIPVLHGHVHARYEWEPADRVGGPVWRYPKEVRNDPAHAYSDERHGELRAALTAELTQLMESPYATT